MNILGSFSLSRGSSPCLGSAPAPWMCCSLRLRGLASLSNTQLFPFSAFWQQPGESGSECR